MYFLEEIEELSKQNELLLNRKQRDFVTNVGVFYRFVVGDILSISFLNKGRVYNFEGICIAIKKKKYLNSNMSISLRNVIFGIGLEFIISYFYNRSYSLSIGDYKRKQFIYKRAKLYYLRTKFNVSSFIK